MNTILCALDASDRAPLVLATARQLAQQSGRQLHVIRAVPPMGEVPFRELSVTLGQLTDLVIKESRAQLDTQVVDVPKAMLAGTHVEVGTPWRVVCDLAKKLNVDVIVMGAHGYSAVDRALGTMASAVINHADRDVYVVRQRA